MEPLLALLVAYGPLTFAGAMGGVIHWASAREPWVWGLASVAMGAIIGTYFGPAFFTIIQPATDMTGMDPQDARLLGAHLCGVIGINLYAIPIDYVRARSAALRGTLKEQANEPKQGNG